LRNIFDEIKAQHDQQVLETKGPDRTSEWQRELDTSFPRMIEVELKSVPSRNQFSMDIDVYLFSAVRKMIFISAVDAKLVAIIDQKSFNCCVVARMY
jgi:hypothetical protein